MCTKAVAMAPIPGTGKRRKGWFNLGAASVSYGHPFHVPLEHALNIDSLDEATRPAARVAVEVTTEFGRHIVDTIVQALQQGRGSGSSKLSAGGRAR